MKGQYIAVETVFTFGLGIMIATATLTIFQGIENNFLENGEDEQIDLVFSKVRNVLNVIRTVDDEDLSSNITYEIEIPEQIANSEYRAEFKGQKLNLDIDSKVYSQSVSNFEEYSISGSFQGGSVTVIKNQNQLYFGNN